jgi:hypothetical protein
MMCNTSRGAAFLSPEDAKKNRDGQKLEKCHGTSAEAAPLPSDVNRVIRAADERARSNFRRNDRRGVFRGLRWKFQHNERRRRRRIDSDRCQCCADYRDGRRRKNAGIHCDSFERQRDQRRDLGALLRDS